MYAPRLGLCGLLGLEVRRWRYTQEAKTGVRWMPRYLLAMKDVEGCDKLRVAAKQAMIRRSPNGETHLVSTRDRAVNA